MYHVAVREIPSRSGGGLPSSDLLCQGLPPSAWATRGAGLARTTDSTGDSMEVGILGLAGSGKTTLFSLLTANSDISRGFIRAEVVSHGDLLEAGSLSACRERGTLRLEGKSYPVADGDIVHYRFNV